MNNLGIKLRFKGSYLKQEQITFTPKNVVNLFIVYESDLRSRDLNPAFTLKDFLFGAANFAKTADPEKYCYSEYGIGFGSRFLFSILNS